MNRNKIITNIIIWIFKKYAFEEWVEAQEKQSRKEFQERYKLQDDEVDQALLDKQQEPAREAFYEGGERGIYENIKR